MLYIVDCYIGTIENVQQSELQPDCDASKYRRLIPIYHRFTDGRIVKGDSWCKYPILTTVDRIKEYGGEPECTPC